MELLSILALTIPFVLGSGAAGMFKLRSGLITWSIILTTAACCFVAEYFLYDATGFPPWMRWVALTQQSVTARRDNAETTHDEPSASGSNGAVTAKLSTAGQLYKADDTGWMKKESPEGYVYVCVPCKNDVEIAILFGPEMDADAIKRYKDVEARFADKQATNDWVTAIIKEKMPFNDAKIEVNRTDVGTFFNIKMLEYVASVEMMNFMSHETGFVGLHRRRLASVTLNYIDGSMDDTANNAITHFFGSLQFVSTLQ